MDFISDTSGLFYIMARRGINSYRGVYAKIDKRLTKNMVGWLIDPNNQSAHLSITVKSLI